MDRSNLGLWLIIGGLAALVLLNGPWVGLGGARAEWGSGHSWHTAPNAEQVDNWQSAGNGR